MKRILVPGIVALLICISLTVPGLAETGPVNLTITSAAEKGGYITADLQVSPGSGDGYLTLWFNPSSGDCKDARLLSWKRLGIGSDTQTVPMTAAVPIDVTPGTYAVTALYTPGSAFPSSCDKGSSVSAPLPVSASGHDMAGYLSGETVSGSGPRYLIDAISGIDTAIRVEPSSTIQPVLTIKNTGADDTSSQPVEVHAYLGSDELPPVNAVIIPMKAGEVQDATLSYIVPAYIPQQSYPFFLIIDPRGEHGSVDPAANLKRAGGKMSVSIEDPGVGCGCHQ